MVSLTPTPTVLDAQFPDPGIIQAAPAVGYLGTYVFEIQHFDVGVWHDITEYLIDTTWTWGRDYASQWGGRPVPLEITATVRSPAGLFSKYNPASPYLSMLARRGRIRFRMTDPVATTLYHGYMRGSDVDSQLGGIQTVQLRATGLMGYLEQARTSWQAVGRAAYTARGASATLDARTALVFALDGTDALFGSSNIDGDSEGVALFDVWFAHNELFPAAVRLIEASEAGYIGDNQLGGITFHSRHHRYLSARSTDVQATWSDHEYAVLGPASVRPQDGKDQYNRAAVSLPQYTFGPDYPEWETVYIHPREGRPDFYLDPGDTLRVQFEFPNDTVDLASGAAFMNQHQNGFADADDTTHEHIIANSAVDGSGSDMIGDLGVSTFEGPFARKLDVTYINNGAVRMYFPSFRIAAQIGYSAPPATAAYEDETSIDEDGPLDFPIEAPFVPAIDAPVYVNHVVETSKDVRPIVEVGFKANHSEAMLTEVVTRDVADRILLETDGIAPLSTGIQLVGQFFVETCSHRVTMADGIHTSIFHLSEADETPTLWILGESQLGIDTALVF